MGIMPDWRASLVRVWLAVPVSAVLMASAVPITALAQSASFQGLGFLGPVSSNSDSEAVGVSADGTIVVGSSVDAAGHFQAFRWSGGAMVGLGFVDQFVCGFPPAAFSTVAHGVSADGAVVVGSASSVHQGCFAQGAFRWTSGAGMVDILGPPPIGQLINSANGANADGTIVVGGRLNSSNSEAFRWVAGTVSGLGFLPGGSPNTSVAFGVSGDGTVVVGQSSSSGGNQAFRWTVAGGMAGLGFLPGDSTSTAVAVSADGTVVVGSSGSGGSSQAFRWIAGTMTGLGFLAGDTTSQATALNGSGSVVVGCSGTGNGCAHAFRWSAAAGMESIRTLLVAAGIDLTGWTLTRTVGISSDGTVIAGDGVDPSGRSQGWIAQLPAPAQPTNLVAAVAPNARTATVGTVVTAFATIINSGAMTARSCSIASPAGVPATFAYQTTNAQNTPTGTANTPVDIAPGQGQPFFFAITPTAVFTQELQLAFQCTNTNPAPVVFGLNTFLVSAGATPLPDMLSIVDTLTHDGIANVPGPTGTGLIAMAAIDIGAGGTVMCAPTSTPVGQPPRSLAANVSFCQTNAQGQCINPATPGTSSTLTVANNQTVFFAAFIQGQGSIIPFDPASNRVFLICSQGQTAVGEASAAVRTQ